MTSIQQILTTCKCLLKSKISLNTSRGEWKGLACSWLSFVSTVAAQFLVTNAVVVFFSRYTPKTIEIEHKLQPFIPDFIPAVGDIDAFLKVWFLQVPLSVLPHEPKWNAGSEHVGSQAMQPRAWAVPVLSDMMGGHLGNYTGGLVTSQTALD